MSEKKTNIKEGKNIELDDVIVLNEGITLSEEPKEEKVEETPVEKAKEEVSSTEDELPTPDKVIGEEASVEVPEEPVAPISIELPDISADIPEVSADVAPTITVVDEPVVGIDLPPETNEIAVPTEEPAVTNTEFNSFDNPFASNTVAETPSFENPSFDNSSFVNLANNSFSNYVNDTQDELPEGVKTAVGMVENEVKEIIKENTSLKIKNEQLELDNNNLRNQVSSLQSKIQILENEKANMQNSMTNVQSRILDVFGASNLMRYNNISNNQSFGDDQMNNGGMGMSV